MLPLLHDFDGETVLILGGGPVGARKARRFASEADVVVLASGFADADFGGAERVRTTLDGDAVSAWVARTDPALVVTATDDGALNTAAAEAAREVGALVNRADEAGGRAADSVVVPATIRDGDVVVAVATGGRSPALSRYLRERIEDEVGDLDLEGMAALLAEVRGELAAGGYEADARREALRAVVRSREVWTAFHTPGTNERETAADVISDVTGDPA